MENLCRLCLKPEIDYKFKAIFVDNNKTQIAAKIFLITGVQIVECTNNPALICKRCEDDLKVADLLRKKSLRADNYFRRRIPKEFFVNGAGRSCNAKSFSEYSLAQTPLWKSVETQIKREREPFEAVFVKAEPKAEPIQSEVSEDKIHEHSHTEHHHQSSSSSSSEEEEEEEEEAPRELTPSKMFRCPLCAKVFRKWRNMDFHTVLAHNRPKSVVCSLCGIVHTDLVSYKTHYVSGHLKVKNFPCKYCNAKYVSKCSLRGHLKLKHRRQCSTCNQTFTSIAAKTYHEKILCVDTQISK